MGKHCDLGREGFFSAYNLSGTDAEAMESDTYWFTLLSYGTQDDPSRGGTTSHISHQSRRCTTVLATGPAGGSIFSVEVPSQMPPLCQVDKTSQCAPVLADLISTGIMLLCGTYTCMQAKHSYTFFLKSLKTSFLNKKPK